MNFEFSADQLMIQDQARSFLAANSPLSQVRKVLEDESGEVRSDKEVWHGLSELGWPGVAIPEAYGGLGMGYLELCVIAEELGRSLAATPFSSSVYLATELLLLAGTESQKQHWLPRLAAGEVSASIAMSCGSTGLATESDSIRAENSVLNGKSPAVSDGDIVDLLIVAAQDENNTEQLYLLETNTSGVAANPVTSIDPSRALAAVEFNAAQAELMQAGSGGETLATLYDRAAVLFAFEQVGGAQACLDMAKEYTMQRYAFGRPIASFQALKHKMADMFVAIELAKSNAYYGAWALSTGSDSLTEAAAVARISATDAYYQCSKENMQAHGGMGYTWELDCHLYYRRARYLAAILGSQSYWKDRLIAEVA